MRPLRVGLGILAIGMALCAPFFASNAGAATSGGNTANTQPSPTPTSQGGGGGSGGNSQSTNTYPAALVPIDGQTDLQAGK